ncbi:zinc finger protein 653 isoform 2-T2 [Menidia menidia]
MAHRPADGCLVADQTVEQGVLRRCRGRPRLTDSDRAQRRLESRKKYDVRRVYLGESHKLWSELRRRTSLSDAGLAEYLILLNSTYGDQYQQKHCGKKTVSELSEKQKRGRKQSVSSLQSLVCWYQEHARSCPHEPQLRALEPQADFSTAAIWQCHSDHSFVQYLYSPLRGDSDSEQEECSNVDSDGEMASSKDAQLSKGPVSRQRRKECHRKFTDVGEDVSEEHISTTSQTEETGAPNHHPVTESPSGDAALTGRPDWEVEMVPQQGSFAEELDSMPAEEEEDATEDLRRGKDGREREAEEVGEEEEETRSAGHDYQCITASLAELEKGGGLPVPPPMQVHEQTELFDHQALQSVVTGCEIPDQRVALEASQLIIISAPSYEALASEEIQLNVASGNVEEVSCSVIGTGTYSQVCTLDSKIRAEEDEDAMTEADDKQLLQPAVDTMELGSNREMQRCLSSVRSKRNRRGPVIEADGMLKMFHCPYEGCSQVYVAISSFQNHVNLVHRKGRTKVCPHPGCGKKFYLSNHLHRHMIIHSGVRDFICETCGKSFKRKNHLEVHRRTHTGETPLQCEICGYQCRQRASLNWHMRKHTPEAHYNFTCDFCDKRFEKLDSVKFHKLKSHPEKQAT